MDRDTLDRHLDCLRLDWKDIMGQTQGGEDRGPSPALLRKASEGAILVALPKPEDLEVPATTVMAAIAGRQSLRKYTAEALSLDQLSCILWAALGIRTGDTRGSFRTAPSAGNRQSLEGQVLVSRVAGLAPGHYRYLPEPHALELVRPWDEGFPGAMGAGLFGQFPTSPAHLIWSAVPWRMAWRYGQGAAKLMALDAGHSCENVYLMSEALGCGACAIASFDGPTLDTFLGLDGKEEFSLYAVSFGPRP